MPVIAIGEEDKVMSRRQNTNQLLRLKNGTQSHAIGNILHNELEFLQPTWADSLQKSFRGSKIGVYSLDHMSNGGRAFRKLERSRRREGLPLNLRYGRRPDDFDDDRLVLSLVGFRGFDELHSVPVAFSTIAMDQYDESISLTLSTIFVPAEHRGQHYGLRMVMAICNAFLLFIEKFGNRYQGSGMEVDVVFNASYESEKGERLCRLISENIEGSLNEINRVDNLEQSNKLQFRFSCDVGY